MTPCPKCNQQALAALAGLRPGEMLARLDELETDGRPGATAMVKAAQNFLKSPTGWLSIYGPYGNGKSTVLRAVVAECLRRGMRAKYMTLTELMFYVYEAYDNEKAGESDWGRIKNILSYQVLAIDELDKYEMDTSNARKVQSFFFDERYRMANFQGTMFAWNGSMNTLNNFPAVIDRMSEFAQVENKDQSFRRALGMVAMETMA